MRRALFGTIQGRAIVVGLATKVAVFALGLVLGNLPPFLGVVDTVAGAVVAVAGAALLVGGLATARRRLLWRVRRKLIISYIFIGFVPATLIVAFFLLAGLLLFSNVSSYLLQSQLRTFVDRARTSAEEAGLELQQGGPIAPLLARRQHGVERETPGASMAIVPLSRACDGRAVVSPRVDTEATGPWAHVAPPARIPEWLGCDGFSGLLPYESAAAETGVLARAVVFPLAERSVYAVVVDLPVDLAARQRLQGVTGVWLQQVAIVGGTLAAIPGRDGAGGGSAGVASALPLNGVSFLESRDWTTGATGGLMATMRLNIRDVYNAMSGSQGSAAQLFRQGLLLALLVIGVLLLFIQVVALFAGLTLAKSITGSVHELFAGTERVRQGDFIHKIAVRSDDQLGELAESFNSMTASIEDLLTQAAEKKRLEEELRIAHDIQMSLLPQGPLTLEGLSVTAVCVPAREVGGDYYDFLPLDDRRVGVLVADVSGKGTSAALYMAELKGLVLSLSRIYTSPRALLVAANQIIAEHLDARSFITITYAVVDLGAGTMTYARAGHTPLIHVPGPAADDRRARILAPDGMVLGLKLDQGQMFERLLEESTITLSAGDLCVFFTDGVSEAMNEKDELFGDERLGRLVEEHAHLPPHELRERILREIAQFVGAAPQHDDMTMILLKIEHLDGRMTAPAPTLVEILV